MQVKFSISRISFVCTWLTSFNSSYFFWYNPISLKKDGTSSILTFSNNSVRLSILKNRFLMAAKALHSIKMCLTVQIVWQVKNKEEIPATYAVICCYTVESTQRKIVQSHTSESATKDGVADHVGNTKPSSFQVDKFCRLT